jgi:hypothetical protein
MLRAILRNGVIQPLEPLPAEWQEGLVLRVGPVDDKDVRQRSAEEIDDDFRILEEMSADSEPADEERLMRFLNESRRLGKECMRRQMGLS